MQVWVCFYIGNRSETALLCYNTYLYTLFYFLKVGALVITPTRELALQISEVMEGFLLKFPQFK